jgi:RNA polymerase sigma factor (sigma-70 family)
MTIMNIHEKQLVETHLYMVRSIVLGTMSINESIQGLGYDDLYQVGCEALCHAAMHYRDGYGASFATFADTVIKNRLISHCRKMTRIQSHLRYLDMPLSDDLCTIFSNTLQKEDGNAMSDVETLYLLSEAEKHYSGISQKGIKALKLKCMGHSNIEIADYYGVKPNHIAAWISRAVSKLRIKGVIIW